VLKCMHILGIFKALCVLYIIIDIGRLYIGSHNETSQIVQKCHPRYLCLSFISDIKLRTI